MRKHDSVLQREELTVQEAQHDWNDTTKEELAGDMAEHTEWADDEEGVARGVPQCRFRQAVIGALLFMAAVSLYTFSPPASTQQPPEIDADQKAVDEWRAAGNVSRTGGTMEPSQPQLSPPQPTCVMQTS